MLGIDCLFKNTHLLEDIKTAVKYFANERAANEMPADVGSVYNDIRKAGVEVDYSTIGHIYANELPVDDERFSSLKDIEKSTGRDFDNTFRDLLLQKPKKGEQEIGKQSPAQAAAKQLVDAFSSKLIKDERTKSMMRQMQDLIVKGSERLLGEAPPDANKPAPKTAEEIIAAALESETKGYRDANGDLNGIKKVFDATREELKRYTDALEAQGDHATVEQWNNYIKGMEDATYSLLFSSKEGKQILKEALLKNFGKTTKTGTVLDWAKLAGRVSDVTALHENVFNAFKDKFGDDVANRVASSMGKEFQELRGEILNRADNILRQKEAMLDKENAPSKSDMTRLAEYHDLGIFNGQHDKLLAKILGVEEHDRKTMNDVKEYAEQLSKLRQILGGNSFLAPFLERQVAHHINEIVARNIENKTKLLKAISTVHKIYQIENLGLITGYRNLTENHMSGAIEYLTTKVRSRFELGKDLGGQHKELAKYMADMWKNIGAGGHEYGEAPYQVGATQVNIGDSITLRKMKGADLKSPKTYIKAALLVPMTIGRSFLSGTDGGFKVGLYRQHFLMGMHDALVRSGQYTHSEAIEFLNNSFYGDGALDRAKTRAQEIYDQTGIKYTSQKEVNLLANELLHENLLQDKQISPELIREVQRNAYRQAGLGMGHESNNVISKFIQSSKLKMQRAELQAFNNREYNKAAKIKAMNIVTNSVILRFAASQYNWAMIRLEQAGLGFITGMYHYNQGKKIEAKGLLNMTEGERVQMTEQYQLSRQKMFRAGVGVAFNAMATSVLMPMLANALYGDDEDPMQKLFDSMGDHYLAKALFIKLAPIWSLGQYYNYGIKSKKDKEGGAMDRMFTAAMETSQNVFNFGDNNSSIVKFADASKKITQGMNSGNDKEKTKGWTEIAQIFGNMLPHVPFYKPAKDVLGTIKYFEDGKDPMYKYPYGFMSGLLGGGVLEDIGALGQKPLISLPYVSQKTMETFQYNGIQSINDIKEKYGTGPEAEQFIREIVGGGDKANKTIKAYHAEVGE